MSVHYSDSDRSSVRCELQKDPCQCVNILGSYLPNKASPSSHFQCSFYVTVIEEGKDADCIYPTEECILRQILTLNRHGF